MSPNKNESYALCDHRLFAGDCKQSTSLIYAENIIKGTINYKKETNNINST